MRKDFHAATAQGTPEGEVKKEKKKDIPNFGIASEKNQQKGQT